MCLIAALQPQRPFAGWIWRADQPSPSPPHLVQYRTWKNAETERAGRSWRENRITFAHGAAEVGLERRGIIVVGLPRGGGRGGEEEEEEEGLWREEGGRSTLGVYARPEIQLRSIDRLRCSRQISVRCEIRRLVSLASWSRGLLASDTFDSSNRFVTRNRNFSKGDLPDSNGGKTGCLPLIDNDRFGGRERGG